MGLLSLSNLAICIQKAELSDFKAKVISKVGYYPKFNLGQLNAYKLMEKRMSNLSGDWIFSFCMP